MNDDERRLHDWLDGELDRMAIGGDRPVDPRRVFASETDRALSETAAELRRRDQRQAAEPSAAFLNDLEHQLMASHAPGTSWSGPVARDTDPIRTADGQVFRPQGDRPRRNSMVYRLATFAIVLALIGGTIFSIGRLRDNGSDSPNTIPAQGVGSLETPTPEEPSQPGQAEWRVSTDASAAIAADEYGRTGGLAVVDGVIIRAWTNAESSGLEGISAADGSVLWTNPLEWQDSTTNFPRAVANFAFQHDDQNIYVLNQIQPADETISEAPPLALTAIAIASGEEVWTREFDGGVATVGTGPAGLFVQSYGERLQKIDPASGETIWTYSGDTEVSQGIAPYSGNEALIVVNRDGVVSSVDPNSGELNWQIETGHPSYYFSIAEGALESGETVIVVRSVDQLPESFKGERFAETKSALMAVDFETGEILWTQTLNSPSKGEMQISDGMIYATTSLVRYPVTNDTAEQVDTGFRNWLVAIDLETGAEIWSIESDPAWGMAFEIEDNRLVMYRSYGAFVTVNLDSHEVACDAWMPSGASSDDEPQSPDAGAYDGESLYLSLKNGDVMAVNPNDWTC